MTLDEASPFLQQYCQLLQHFAAEEIHEAEVLSTFFCLIVFDEVCFSLWVYVNVSWIILYLQPHYSSQFHGLIMQ